MKNDTVDLTSYENFIVPNIDFNFSNISEKKLDIDKILSNHYKVSQGQIDQFSGKSSAIYSLLNHIQSIYCYLYSPIEKEYKNALENLNFSYELVNRYIDISPDIMEGSLVIFSNPSVPDGVRYDLDSMIEQWIRKNCIIIIDESFLNFTTYKSYINYINYYEQIYIIKSMDSFYSNFPIKLSSIISSKSNIKNIKDKSPKDKISVFDSYYISQSLADKHFSNISKAINTKNKEYLINILKGSKYVDEVYPSSTNFILVKLKGIDSLNFQALLKEDKIIISTCIDFDFLDESFITICVKSRNDLEKLKKTIDKKG
jgi:threonine-phosphate decarboxylase